MLLDCTAFKVVFALVTATAVAVPIGHGFVHDKQRRDVLVAWNDEVGAAAGAASTLRELLAPATRSNVSAFKRGPGVRQEEWEVNGHCYTFFTYGYPRGESFNAARSALWPVAMSKRSIDDLVRRMVEHAKLAQTTEAELKRLGSSAPSRLDRTTFELAERWRDVRAIVPRVVRSKPVQALTTVEHRDWSRICM